MIKIGRISLFWAALGLFLAGVNASTNVDFNKNLITLTPQDSEYVLSIGRGFSVTCSGEYESDLKWLKPDRSDVASKGRVHVKHVEDNGTIIPHKLQLIITSVHKIDQGEWTCEAEGDEDGGKSFVINVFIPISFEKVPNVLTQTEKDDVTIRCEVKGHPEPSITWEHNGNSMIEKFDNQEVKYKKLGDGLFIRSVNRSDGGEYTCKAFQISEKIQNMEQQTVLLNVQYPPVMLGHQHKKRFGFLHSTVNLTCEADGNPRPEFIWYRHNKKMFNNVFSDTYISHLQIYIKSNDSFGEYKCKARNELGDKELVIDLIEGKKPDSPKIFMLRGLSSDTFDIDVGAKIDFKKRSLMEIKGFRFELIPKELLHENNGSWSKSWVRDFPIADGVTYLLSPLSENTTYMIRVASRNTAGFSDWTGPTEFSTLPKQPFIVGNSASFLHSSQFSNVLVIFLVFLKIQIIA